MSHSIVSIGTYEGNLVGWESAQEAAVGAGGAPVAAAPVEDHDSDSGSDSDSERRRQSSVLRAAAGPLGLVYAFQAHEAAIRAVAIDGSGKLLVTGAADESTR
jgi:hypothetical protein